MASEPEPDEAPESNLRLALAGLGEARVAFREGMYLLSLRPGLLLLFFLPQLVVGAVSIGLRHGAGFARDSILYTTSFSIGALLVYVPVLAAAVLQVEAMRGGGFLTHREALRQALGGLRFLLVPFLVTWFGIEAIVNLMVVAIPFIAFGVADTPQGVLEVLPAITTTLTLVEAALLLFLAGRLLVALPDRVLSEEEPPKLWPALVVLALVAARALMAGATTGFALGGVVPGPGTGGALAGPALGAILGVSLALLFLFLLSIAGVVPAGLRWSWRASRDTDLFAASLLLVLLLALALPRTWVYMTSWAWGDAALELGVYLYLLALLLLVGGVGGQWGLGFILAGLMFFLFLTIGWVPLLNLFFLVGMWLIPLAILSTSATVLYLRMTEEAE